MVHGINTRDKGAETVDRLKPFLDIETFQDADYGNFSVWMPRFNNKTVAKVMAGMAWPSSVAIAHSNGCTVSALAANKTNKIKKLFLFNPALDSDFVFAPWIEEIHVFHNPTDRVVQFARLSPFNIWGNMGRIGYTGPASNVHNYNMRDLFGVEGHSAQFNAIDSIIASARIINQRI